MSMQQVGRRHAKPPLRARGNRRVMCLTGKVRFRTRRDATKQQHLSEARRLERTPVRAYQCWACEGGWHLTSQEEWTE